METSSLAVRKAAADAHHVARHRALPRARVRGVGTGETTPGPFDPRQPITRRVLDAGDRVP